MDIVAIQEAIDTLENSDTTVDNVIELASLYIVSQNYKSGLNRMVTGVEKELNDILPSYRNYVNIKRNYQMNRTTEGEVAKGIKVVCKELTEFIDTLYSSTDMGKERHIIVDMLNKLNEKYSK